MAHEPKPHGAFQEGNPASEEEAGVAAHLLKRLQAVKAAGNLPAHKMTRSLQDGGYVIAQDMGGVVKTFIVKPPAHDPEPEIDPFAGVATLDIPMLYCGRVVTPRVKGEDPIEVHLTKHTLRRLRSYDDDKADGASKQSFYKFRVGYHAVLSEFTMQGGAVADPPMAPTEEVVMHIHPLLGPVKQLVYSPLHNWTPPPPAPKNSEWFESQYTQAHPTWWSGAMAEVVQIVSGFGSQDKEKVPENEREGLNIPAAVLARMGREKAHINVRLPGYTGKPPKDGQLRFNYKFNHTDVVSFDTENKPWLVRIEQRGVYAMPLPLIPVTTTKTFREWVGSEEDWSVSDPELEHIVKRFGGIPSGETMPFTDGAFKAWERAGVIIKVCDVGDFYDHIMYSSACGWSVNSKGTEGFNTCYDYDDNGFGVGFAYKLKLRLGAAENSGKLPEGFNFKNEKDSAVATNYLAGLYRQLREASAKNLAIKYKIRRAGADEVLSRAGSKEGESDVDYWDNLKLDPIASHTGSINQVGKGSIFYPSSFRLGPQIKFPEPLMWGCISHDFRALRESSGKPRPKCDTIMFGYYVGDDLKVVKFFWEPRFAAQKVEGELDPCTGEGSQTTTSEGSLSPYFHTTDFDDREAASDKVSTYHYKLEDLGFDTPPRWMFEYLHRTGTLFRYRHFKATSNSVTTLGGSTKAGLCIPYLCRNALLYAYERYAVKTVTIVTVGPVSFRDPNSYQIWTYDWNLHWKGGLTVMKGVPYPRQGSHVWAEIHDYKPNACSDIADEGDWVGSLPMDVMGKMPGWHAGNYEGGGTIHKGGSQVVESQEGPKTERRLHFSMSVDGVRLDQMDVDGWYFTSSPSLSQSIFYRDATRNVCGDAEYSIVSEPFGNHTKWGNTTYADHKSTARFIGVIHE